MTQKIAALTTLIIGLAQAVIGLLAAFGVELTAEQNAAIIGVLGAVLALVGAWQHPNIPVGNRS